MGKEERTGEHTIHICLDPSTKLSLAIKEIQIKTHGDPMCTVLFCFQDLVHPWRQGWESRLFRAQLERENIGMSFAEGQFGNTYPMP